MNLSLPLVKDVHGHSTVIELDVLQQIAKHKSVLKMLPNTRIFSTKKFTSATVKDLMHDLVVNDLTQEQAASKYGLSKTTISVKVSQYILGKVELDCPLVWSSKNKIDWARIN